MKKVKNPKKLTNKEIKYSSILLCTQLDEVIENHIDSFKEISIEDSLDIVFRALVCSSGKYMTHSILDLELTNKKDLKSITSGYYKYLFQSGRDFTLDLVNKCLKQNLKIR